ncbi:copper transporter [Dehalobacterium formicoaceticum]|uniref:Copper transporter n=1 Tax=Dehalobacterium formicoaceticum TaxID=51515 RepID=A0ABT1Y5X7_9FIRM|nr:copper transporter [Dehalobacterium formicoaceticum]MCR6546285.1 copper transporter [Dehalobacterium formicoaceticum]
MIDFKYHVTALVAIFLALGIGMLIGSQTLGNEFIGSQQEALINRLEGDFQQLRIQNGLTQSQLAAANEEADTYQEICRQMMPALIKNKLENYRVVVVQTNSNQKNSLNEIINPLELAGAQVDAVISLANDFSLAHVSSSLTLPETDAEKPIMELLGEAILFGDENGIMSDFAEEGMINISGVTGNSIDAVILVGGSDRESEEQVKNLDLILADFFIRKDVKVIGVESSSVSYSYIPYYNQNGHSKLMATVDNIDDITGQISLIYSILGAKGDFGVKETAKSLMPDLLQMDW